MLGVLATFAIAAADLTVDVLPPRSQPPPVWGALVAEGGRDDRRVVGHLAYESAPGVVAMVVQYEAVRGLPPLVSVTALAGRRLDPRTRLDLQVWREVGRGGGAGFVVRRQLGR